MRRTPLFLLCATVAVGVFAGKDHLAGRIFERAPLTESVYAPPAPERMSQTAPGAGDLNWALARVTVDEGATLFRRCSACHKLDPDARALGPHLVGVFGRKVGGLEDFAYSDALTNRDDVWRFETLSAFIADPRGWAPGTSKTFSGVDDVKDRAAILVYLNAIAPKPQPLPDPTAFTQ